MFYACKIICFIRIGEIRIGTQRSSAHFRACIFALGHHTIRKIIHKSGIRICIMIRDLRYAAVISVRIGYTLVVISIVPCLGLPVKIIIRKFNKISVSVSLLGHKPRFIIFYFGKGSPIRAVAHEVFGRSAESVIGKFILQMIVDVYALQQVIGIRIAVRYAAR